MGATPQLSAPHLQLHFGKQHSLFPHSLRRSNAYPIRALSLDGYPLCTNSVETVMWKVATRSPRSISKPHPTSNWSSCCHKPCTRVSHRQQHATLLWPTFEAPSIYLSWGRDDPRLTPIPPMTFHMFCIIPYASPACPLCLLESAYY